MQKNISLDEIQAAWQELLCLQSWYNEMSSEDERYDELVYRLLAAEKWYQTCLRRLQKAGICRYPTPHSGLAKKPKIMVNGCWYYWQ
ncbi:MAG: hypothetical protein WAO24_01405 [Peptococcia bacterium]